MESVPEEVREKMAAMTPGERSQFIAEQMRALGMLLGASHSIAVVAVAGQPATQYYTAFHGEGVFIRGLGDLANDTIKRLTLIPNSYRERVEGDLRGTAGASAGGGGGAGV